MKVYLSGGMEGAKNFGGEWRERIEKWVRETLNHDVFNPTIESVKFLKEKYPGVERSNMPKEDVGLFQRVIGEIVLMDCEEIIHNCDYVVCYWDESCYRGAGTQGEVTIAKYFQKPVYLVTQVPLKEVPGWVIGCSIEVFKSIDELKEYLLGEFQLR
jgi:hypothetical protein